LLYLPVNKATAKDLSPEVLARLAVAGITSDEWLDLTAKVLFRREKEMKAEAKRAPRCTRKPFLIEEEYAHDFVAAQERLLEYISPKRAVFPTNRDDWDAWVDAGGPMSISDRCYSALCIMIMTPRTYDKSVEPVVLKMMRDGLTSAEKMLKTFADGVGVEDCLRALALRIKKCGMQNKSASFIIQLSLVCIAIGRTPNTYVELVSMAGIGMKVSDVVLGEILGTVVGIPCDVHMIRMFSAIGWTNAECKNGDTAAMQVMSWLPMHLWLGLNKCFAGMGQILQENNKRREDFVQLLKEGTDDEWILGQIEKILAIPEYQVSSIKK